jgi:hypothetical protein
MDPGNTLRCTAAVPLAALVLASAAWSPQALAQSGNGLYEPFPEAAVKERAQRYVERLGDRTPGSRRPFSDAELERGVFVDPDRSGVAEPALRPGAGGASARSGAAGEDGLALPVQLLLLGAALLLPTVALTRGGSARAA